MTEGKGESGIEVLKNRAAMRNCVCVALLSEVLRFGLKGLLTYFLGCVAKDVMVK